MKKTMIFLGALLLVLLTGCSGYEDYGKNILIFDKEGKIEEEIYDSFTESYYSEAELVSSIETEVSSYNDGSEVSFVSLESCEVEEGNVAVCMNYASAKDYAAFNRVGLFHGSLSELVQSEYHGYADLKDAEGKMMPLSTIVASGEEYQAVALDVDCIVEVKGTICYVSDGIEIISKKAADVTLSDEAVYAYIVYK